jgi:hypothetical protein
MRAHQRRKAANEAARTTRDSEIARRFAAGDSRKKIALDFGLTPRRITQIAAALGVRHTHDQIQIIHDHSKRLAGRPRLHIPEPIRPHYVKVRRILGAAAARTLLDAAA